MRLATRLIEGLRAILSGARVERELDDELRQFFEASVDAKLAVGMSRDDAERAARLELGSPAAVKDWVSDVGWETRLESVWQDVRYALRSARRSPGFACAAIGTLALGLGVTAAMYAVVDAVLLKPLPYSNPDRIIEARLRTVDGLYGLAAGTVWRLRHLPAVEYVTAVVGMQATMTGADMPRLVTGEAASHEFFEVFGVPAAIGRTFIRQDTQQDPAIVLSAALWRRAFGADRNILGRTIRLNGRAHVVVGVMPSGFVSPRNAAADFWVVHTPSGAELSVQGTGAYEVFARLRVDLNAARTQAAGLPLAAGANVVSDQPSLSFRPVLADVAESYARTLWTLLAAVGLVLFLACANVSNLLLARARTRQPELAMRAAIGASRGRIARQMITECVVLACMAALSALAVAWVFLRALRLLPVPDTTRIVYVSLDVRVFLALLVFTFAAVFIVGLAPALTASRDGHASPSGRSSTRRGARRTSQALIALEIAVTILLLIGTGLVALRIKHLLDVDFGFNPNDLRVASLRPIGSQYRGERLTSFYTRVAEHLRANTGIEVAMIDHVPLDRWLPPPVQVEAGPKGAPSKPSSARVRILSAGALRFIGADMLRGRDFTDRDGWNGPRVAVVNESFARGMWNSLNVIGAPVVVTRDRVRHDVVIVGVVKDVRDSFYRPSRPEIYVSAAQFPMRQTSVVFRSRRPAEDLTSALRLAVLEVDPAQAASDVASLTEIAGSQTSYSRFVASLFVLFAALAIVLAATGVLAVAAGTVASRTREIGIRMAIGATRSDVVRCLVRDLLPSVLLGSMVGSCAAAALTGVLRSLIRGVDAFHPLAYGGAVVLLLVTVACGAWLPVRRALSIAPTVALASPEEW